MKTFYTILAFASLALIAPTAPQAHPRSDAHIVGHVLSNGRHLPFATIVIQGTTIGTSTDETGHYRMINVPPGTYTLIAKMMGYKPQEAQAVVVVGQTLEVNFELQEDAFGLESVVVSADRAEQRRSESTVIVSTITPQVFALTQSVALSEGLNFSPGLRVENNCQNCGFNQLRMNGLEGPYTQILINSRPIFSGLAGVYGLELIPSNMIDRVEVIRGGGSALFGSNAIAGTVNLILKDPIYNSYELRLNSAATGVGVSGSAGAIPDHSVQFNASVVSPDIRTGLAVYGFLRERP